MENVFRNSLVPCNATVIVANNTVEPVSGEVVVEFSVFSETKDISVRLVPSLSCDCVLGVDFLRAFKFKLDFGNDSWSSDDSPSTHFSSESQVVKGNFMEEKCAGLSEISNEQRDQVEQLVNKLVKKPGKKLAMTNLAELVIELTDEKPIKQNPRRYSPPILKAAHEAVEKLLSEDIIEFCKSPWYSRPVLAPKSDGKYPFCIDFRRLNDVTKKHVYLIPNIDSILDKLRNARFITKIDMSQAFHCIPIAKECRKYTGFSIPGLKQYCYKRMPYGLSNASAVYQEMIDNFIRDLPGIASDHVFAYIDQRSSPSNNIFPRAFLLARNSINSNK